MAYIHATYCIQWQRKWVDLKPLSVNTVSTRGLRHISLLGSMLKHALRLSPSLSLSLSLSPSLSLSLSPLSLFLSLSLFRQHTGVYRSHPIGGCM
jgi:hypothetical protein